MNPATIYGAVVWGVVAGLLTSPLLFVLGLFFARILIPWYQDLIYQGVDLHALWTEEKVIDTIRYRYQMQLTRSEHTI